MSLWLAACSVEMTPSKGAATNPDAEATTGTTSASADDPDSGMVTRGAGMPNVPIHRADAGARVDASIPVGNAPPVAPRPAETDAGSDAGVQAEPRLDAGLAPEEPLLDASNTLPPPVALPLPPPIHRYSFSGGGINVPDLAGGTDAIVRGKAQLDGLGAVSFPGQSDSFVELPNGLLDDVTSFTVLVWLSARSDPCGQRALNLFYTQESNTGTLLTSLFLAPHGCPSGLPSVGYLTPGASYNLFGETAIANSELMLLGASYSARSQTLRLIVNGVVQEEQSVPVDVRMLQRARGTLGRSQLEHPQLQGTISELRIYASRLEPNELQEIYARGPDAL
jgi:hypothetical protein